MVNSPLIKHNKALFLGGVRGGGGRRLTRHDCKLKSSQTTWMHIGIHSIPHLT